MNELEKARWERDLNEMRNRIDKVGIVADSAAHSISTHEQVCSLRYETISAKLEDIPRIFTLLGGLQKHVYIGVGLIMAVGAVLRVLG